jgi:hypothetical protein
MLNAEDEPTCRAAKLEQVFAGCNHSANQICARTVAGVSSSTCSTNGGNDACIGRAALSGTLTNTDNPADK